MLILTKKHITFDDFVIIFIKCIFWWLSLLIFLLFFIPKFIKSIIKLFIPTLVLEIKNNPYSIKKKNQLERKKRILLKEFQSNGVLFELKTCKFSEEDIDIALTSIINNIEKS
jgi:hypothetical protein